jgi:hypothetical protein
MQLWAVVVLGCWLFTIVHYRRRQRVSQVTGIGERTLATLWNACWVAMSVAGFGSALHGAMVAELRLAMLAAIIGVGCAVTAPLVRVPALYGVAAGWWLGAVVLFTLPAQFAAAGFAALTIALLLVPAMVLHRRWRRGPAIDS